MRLLSILLLSTLACGDSEERTLMPTPEPSPMDSTTVPEAVDSKWVLWINGTHLRGANIYQRRVYPELNGPTFIGSGIAGPPYKQEEFDRLAALGANYVKIYPTPSDMVIIPAISPPSGSKLLIIPSLLDFNIHIA